MEKSKQNKLKLNEQLFNVIFSPKDSKEAKLKKVKYLIYLGADKNARKFGKSVLSLVIENNLGDELVDFFKSNGAEEYSLSDKEREELGKRLWKWGFELSGFNEAQKLLTELKMGVALDFIRFKEIGCIEELIADVMPYSLTKISEMKISASDLDKFRASFLSKVLKSKRIK